MARKLAKTKTTKAAAKHHKSSRSTHTSHTGESMDDIQVSITRALLGIIAIAIFIGFFLSPFSM